MKKIILLGLFATAFGAYADSSDSCRSVAISSVDLERGEVVLSFGDSSGFGAGELFMAYGSVIGGTTTNGWETVEKVGDIKPADDTYACAIPDGFGESYSAIRFFLFIERSVEIDDYVAAQLYAQWDGIDNAGRGVHVDSASTWVNLCDNTVVPVYHPGGEATFTDNAFHSDSMSSYFNLANASSWWNGAGDYSTWEAFVTPGDGWKDTVGGAAGIMGAHYTAGCNGVVFGQIGHGAGHAVNFCVCRSQEGGVGSIDLPYSAISGGEPMHLAYVVTPASATVYTNGALYATVSMTMPLPLGETTFNIGAAYDGADRGFCGDIHAIRVYSRALDAAEIAANAAVDYDRFINSDVITTASSHTALITLSETPVIEYGGDIEVRPRRVVIPLDVVTLGLNAASCNIFVCYGSSPDKLSVKRCVAADFTGDAITASIAGLEPSTTYYLSGYAVNKNGEGTHLAAVNFTTPAEVAETYGSGRPIIVSGTNIVSGVTSVTLTIPRDDADTAEYSLFAAYGSDFGGNALVGWQYAAYIASVGPEDTEVTYQLPAEWGADILSVRFFLRDSPVPPGYAPYEYVAGSSLYIDTGIVPDHHQIHVEWITANAMTTYGPIFGDRLPNNAGGMVRVLECYGYDGDHVQRFAFNDGTGRERFTCVSDLGVECIAVYGGDYRILDYGAKGEKSNYAVFIDGVEVSDSNGAWPTGEGTLVLFTDPFDYLQAFTGHIRSFWMKDSSGNYAARYFPCVREEDSVAGFYDAVTGGFVTTTVNPFRADAQARLAVNDVSASVSLNWDSHWDPYRGLIIIVR